MIVFCQCSFTLKYWYWDCSLLILIGRENLRFFGRNKSASFDNVSLNSSYCFNTKWKWSNIKQYNIIGSFGIFTAKYSCLDSCTKSNSFVRINSSIWFFTVEKVFHELLNFWNSRRSTDEDDFIDFSFLHTSVTKYLFDWLNSLFK